MVLQDYNLRHVIEFYEANRFLDAYEATQPLWRRPEVAEELSVEQLVHAGRLAGRLGGPRLRRWLFRLAYRREADHPLVVYFVGDGRPGRVHVLEDLIRFEHREDLNSGSPAWDASWQSHQAIVWAWVRGFDRAHELLAKAKESNCERAWVSTCEAWVFCHEDRWDEALAAAERAWEISPGSPAAAAILKRVLGMMGRLAEAVDRLLPVAQAGQSHETLAIAITGMTALAERSDRADRERLAGSAYELCGRLGDLAPLADREIRAEIAHLQMHAAMIVGDRELIGRHAADVRAGFLRTFCANLDANPDGRQMVLPYRPVFQKHMTCMPSSIAAAAGVFGVTLDEDALAAELTYGGTAAWRVLDWLRANGFAAKVFIVTPSLCASLIESGLPFVISMKRPGSAHATAVIGLDEAGGVLMIHDPSSQGWVRALVDRIDEEEKPFGPEGLVFVPQDRAEDLKIIPDHASRPAEAYVEYTKTTETKGPRSAQGVVRALAQAYPDHPLTRRLDALYRAATGELYSAIQIQESLVAEYPNSIVLRGEFLWSLHRTADRARIRTVLSEIVDRGRIRGNELGLVWRYPPAIYVAQYADHLGVTAQGFPRAEKLIWKAVRAEPQAAVAYHALADIYVRQGKGPQSVLPYKVASLLERDNDHFARAHADALRRSGREEDGLAYLSRRVEQLGQLVSGSGAWITVVAALEDYGRPDEAIEAMLRAQSQRTGDADLYSFATRFWIRMGEWDRADAALSAVEATGHRAMYLEAAVCAAELKGDWRRALALCRDWVRELPESVFACQVLLRLSACENGTRASLDLAREWVRSREAHEEFEELLVDALRRSSEKAEAEQIVRTRLDRNPLDAWAWRELAYLLLEKFELSGAEDRKAILAEIEQIAAEAQRLAPQQAPTYILRSHLAEAHGQYAEAAELLLEAASAEPETGYCYDHAWDHADELSAEMRDRVRHGLEEQLLRTIGPLHNARGLCFQIAAHYGAKEAERSIAQWQQQAGDDPEVIEAQVDLLLEFGQGRSDARRAVEILQPAIRRFPNHFDLRLSLAHAHRVLLEEDEEVALWREVLRREPINTFARRRLADMLARRGELDSAVELLRTATRFDPQDRAAWSETAGLLWENQRRDEALATAQEGLGAIPESVELLEQAVDYALELDRHELAVALARDGVDRMAGGAYYWFILAMTLQRSHVTNDLVEIEQALRKSLERNASLVEAAGELSAVLVQTGRYDEAREIMNGLLPLGSGPGPIHSQLAWITRTRGESSKAIDEMAEVVRSWPRHKWAWLQLMEWLEIDEDWDRAKSVLAEVHPVIGDDPGLSSRRLLLLGAAGVPADELDGQWDQLLYDFPEHQSVHLRRFDLLLDREEFDRAEAVLTAIESFHPRSGFLLARKVRLLARADRPADAVSAAMAVWQLPGEDDAWSCETAWAALDEIGMTRPAAQAVLDWVHDGRRVQPRALALTVEDLHVLAPRRGLLARLATLLHLRPPWVAQPLCELLEVLSKADWDDGSYTATVLEALNTTRLRGYALEYWRRNTDPCRRRTPVWQIVGLVLSDLDDWPSLRSWMRDWREHQAVNMWAIVNYSLSLRKYEGLGEDLEELYATSRDVLEHLQHDHSARYHIATLCEATLRLRKQEEFIQLTETYRTELEDEEFGYWMPEEGAAMPEVLFLFRDLLEMPPRDWPRIEDQRRRMNILRAKAKLPPWVRELWRSLLRGKKA